MLEVQHPWGVSQTEGREGSRQSCGREGSEKRFVWGGGRDCCSWQLSPGSIPGRVCGKVQGQRNTRFLSCSPQFLPASLKPIEDKAWSVALSPELSQQLGSSVPDSWQKVDLLPHARGFHCFPFPHPQKALPPGLPQCLAAAWPRGELHLLPGAAASLWGQPSPDRLGSAPSLSAFPGQGSRDGAGSLSGPQTRPGAGPEVPPRHKPCAVV